MTKGKHSIVLELGDKTKEITTTDSYGKAMIAAERMAEDNYDLNRDHFDDGTPVVSFNGDRRSIHIVSSNIIEEK